MIIPWRDTSPLPLKLPLEIRVILEDHVRKQSGLEVCGLLGGVGREVKAIYQIENDASDPQSRFVMNHQQQVAAMIDVQQQGWDVVAIYHSHPTGSPDVPSRSDIADWNFPEALQLIALPDNDGMLIKLKAYEIRNNQYREVPILSE